MPPVISMEIFCDKWQLSNTMRIFSVTVCIYIYIYIHVYIYVYIYK